jgi:ribonuclease BN (tRNA processing enzyme)
MKVRVLGCSGGIGGTQLRTTSLLVDHDILIDAGTGVCDLSLAQMAAIEHVFLTHSHLDHIAALPLLLDAVADLREQALTVHACDATIAALRRHIFNWEIWPDFSEIPSRERPVLRFEPLGVGDTVRLGGRSLTPLPALHTVPALGYHLDSGAASLVFTGDTTVNDDFWPIVNAIAGLRYLIIETAFSDREALRAKISRHLCPAMLASELARLDQNDVEIFVTHLKPGQADLTMAEIEASSSSFKLHRLRNEQVFEF